MTHPKLLDIDPVARALIQHKVRRLVSRCGYGISDQEDLEQDLALHAHRVARHFNPDRGTAVAFYEQVLSRKVKNLASRQFAKKRDWRRVISVNTHALNELAIAIDPIASMDRRLDLGEVISALPPELWRLALQLIFPTKSGRVPVRCQFCFASNASGLT